MASMVAALEEHLVARLAGPSRVWLQAALSSSGEPRAFSQSFALAGRKVRAEARDEPAVPEQLGWVAAGATVDELARVLLLAGAAEAAAEGAEALVSECYRQGDAKEKRAVLRALALLPQPARYLEVAVNACRTSVQTVFEAIACDNPYPERHFPEASFNQMVLKALFTGVALERIQGVRARTTAELSRMAHGYASERRAAGRSVPEDIDRFFPAGGGA